MPKFTLPCVSKTGESVVCSGDFAGQNLILFFYPRDDTSGCTREAIEFTAKNDAFAQHNAVVLGVSKDDVASHTKFIAKHDLGVGLLSDSGSDFCEVMGVWKEKNMYGRKFMGIERTTVLIDGTGTIVRIWPKVKVDGHVDAVLAALSEL